jgi:hypothetical protein
LSHAGHDGAMKMGAYDIDSFSDGSEARYTANWQTFL